MKLIFSFCCLCLPLRNFHVTSGYGYRIHPITRQYAIHYGIDLSARKDTVYAILDGRVVSESYNQISGLHLEIMHDRLESVYAHLSQLLVASQDSVLAGQPVAISGATGRVTAEHLHFALRYDRYFINPLKFFYELINKQQNERKF